jgi:hypothetical protein
MNEYDAVAICVAILGCALLFLGVSMKPRAMHVRIGKFVIAICCLFWGLSHFVERSRAAALPSFASETEFLAEQKKHGFISIGKFDTSWPATYVDELMAEDSISFMRQDGTPHKYSGFGGYRLKVIRLRDAAGGEPIFVLRSQHKF